MKPGAAYLNTFTTQVADGTLTDAASTPTAAAYKNGTADATMSLTVTKISTGNYKVTGMVPSGYVSGDRLDVYVTATIGSVSVGGWLPPDYIDSSFASDILADTSAIHEYVQTLIEGVVLAATQSLYAPAKAGDAMSLTPGERSAVAGVLCDEALAGHAVSGSVAAALTALLTNGALEATAQAIASSVATAISNVAAVKSVVDAIKTVVDATKVVADAVRVVTDRLGGMIELDGAVYRFTLNALEQGPSGSGSSPEDVALAVLAAAVGTGGATVQEVLRVARAAAVGKLEKVDATTYRLYDDDGTTVVATFAVDSGGRTPAAE